MKVFNAQQIREIDRFTIEKEPISSLQLMERAAKACFEFLKTKLKPSDRVAVFCGMGNNGGDGLALARMLNGEGIVCEVFLVLHSSNQSPDNLANWNLLKKKYPAKIRTLQNESDLEKIDLPSFTLILDALLGTGINKACEGLLAKCITWINASVSPKISIDVPSGLFTDSPSPENSAVIRSDLVLSFQFPKLAFLMPANSSFAKAFVLLDIQLHPEAISQQESPYHYTETPLIQALMQSRQKFSHKGLYGHALLLAGSRGKGGAALIAARACLRSGAGLLTLHSTRATSNALLKHLPEAMSEPDSNSDHISEIEKPENYSAIAFGPGVGKAEETQRVLKKILQYSRGPLVIDADGLNILAENKTWLSFLPPNTILTPHPKEFERLAGTFDNDFERLDRLRDFARRQSCIVILKTAHTAVALPDGTVFFNSTGNPGLAKGGSGDGLTGILLGLLSRSYPPAQAALIAPFVHGLAADLCVETTSMESLLISDVIEKLPEAFAALESPPRFPGQ